MATNSAIAWCDATWQVIAGCARVSLGCEHCYSERLLATRHRHLPWAKDLAIMTTDGPRWTGRVITRTDQLTVPLQTGKSTTFFVGDRGDLFHASIPESFIAEVFGVMAVCAEPFHRPGDGHDKLGKPVAMYKGAKPTQMKAPRHLSGPHVFLVLTKRVDRMAQVLNSSAFQCQGVARFACMHAWNRRCIGDVYQSVSGYNQDTGAHVGASAWPLPNVWVGASVCTAAERVKIDRLRTVPAAHRFLSLEPLLEDLGHLNLTGIHQVIVGGESGPGARLCASDWIHNIVQQCAEARVPCFVKQLGSRSVQEYDGGEAAWGHTEPLKDRKGADPSEWPKEVRVRQLAWRRP